MDEFGRFGLTRTQRRYGMSVRSPMGKMTDLKDASDGRGDGQPVILAVGEMAGWGGNSAGLPLDSAITFVEFRELTAELLDSLTPDIVLSPLLCSSFDCLDLAQVLEALGFRGRYRAMSSQVPQPELIRREVKATCPRLDFDLVSVDVTRKVTLN